MTRTLHTINVYPKRKVKCHIKCKNKAKSVRREIEVKVKLKLKGLGRVEKEMESLRNKSKSLVRGFPLLDLPLSGKNENDNVENR